MQERRIFPILTQGDIPEDAISYNDGWNNECNTLYIPLNGVSPEISDDDIILGDPIFYLSCSGYITNVGPFLLGEPENSDSINYLRPENGDLFELHMHYYYNDTRQNGFHLSGETDLGYVDYGYADNYTYVAPMIRPTGMRYGIKLGMVGDGVGVALTVFLSESTIYYIRVHFSDTVYESSINVDKDGGLYISKFNNYYQNCPIYTNFEE